MSIHDAVRSGDRRRALEAVRDRLAAELDVAPSTVVAQLAGQLTKVLAELEGLGERKVSSLDELEKRRQDRLAAAAAPVAAARPAK